MPDLAAYCKLLEDVTEVPITVAEGSESLADFCRKYRFHRVQSYLTPEALSALIEQTEELGSLSVTDALQIRIQLGRAGGQTFFVGPYCCESLTTLDARILLGRSGIRQDRAPELLVYRSLFPVLPARRADRIVRMLLLHMSGEENLPPTRVLDLQAPLPVSDQTLERPYAEMISERYAVERQMMAAVEAGNATAAIQCWRQLHLRMDYLKRQLGNSLETSRASAAVTRTVLRVGGMNAGVPAVILDQITGDASRKNTSARSLDEIEQNTEKLIRELCRAVRRHRQEGSSYLVESVKFHIETHYAEELSVAELAARLDVPESRMIERFRQETGMTPGAWLRKTRMERAAELLGGTRRSIQEVAASVGIPDANYFTKCFRAYSGQTPSAWRKRRG